MVIERCGKILAQRMRIGIAGRSTLKRHHRDRPHRRRASEARGSTILVNIGCTANSSAASRKSQPHRREAAETGLRSDGMLAGFSRFEILACDERIAGQRGLR